MRSLWSVTVLGCAVAAWSFAALAAECRLPDAGTPIPNSVGQTWIKWELPAAMLEARPSPGARLLQFRKDVAARVNPDALALLRRQRAIYAAIKFDTAVFDLVIDGKLGKIASIDCVSQLVLEAHLARFPDYLRAPNEFEAWIAQSGDRLRLYYRVGEGVMVPASPALRKLIAAESAAGAKITHLHNHPFFFANPAGDIAGTLIPSDGDRPSYLRSQRDPGISAAWITNGFDAIHIDQSEFALFPESRR